jgi:hypothetical protein
MRWLVMIYLQSGRRKGERETETERERERERERELVAGVQSTAPAHGKVA